ncbi:MAG: hypothetical protein JSR17_00370 [Proteobacteria bacterium]|nr:hypothetical protein [Pseudomonadota bacterium]
MKRLLAFAPKLPQAADLEPFSHTLDFLTQDFDITWIDPLENHLDLTFSEYADFWRKYLSKYLESYDAFIGFSLGGFILIDNLEQFLHKNKVIILISAPNHLDESLKNKLQTVLSLSHAGKTKEATDLLNQYVFETTSDFEKARKEPWSIITKRLQYGLGYVLAHQLPTELKASNVIVHQLVGEKSRLVTKNNILNTAKTITHIIPMAGNRVLEDNPSFSQKLIKELLYAEK